jgi:hypothetical protein
MRDKLLKGSFAFTLIVGATLATIWIAASYQKQDVAMEQTTHWLMYP